MNRGEILAKASELTNKDRNSVYGPPEINLACAEALIAVYENYRDPLAHRAGHDNAIHQVLNKIGRIATGKPHLDNYLDGTAYFAIAGELSGAGEKKEQNECQPQVTTIPKQIAGQSNLGRRFQEDGIMLNGNLITLFADNIYRYNRAEDVWVLSWFPEAKSSS